MRSKPAIILILLVLLSLSNTYLQAQKPKDRSDYLNWIEPYKNGHPSYVHNGESSYPLLIITVTSVREKPKDGGNRIVIGDGKVSFGANVTDSGTVSRFSRGPEGSKGGCCSEIPEDDLARLKHLLTKLPSDNSILPPNGRRLMIQVRNKNAYDVSVYDLAKGPAEIFEILRLTRSGIRSHVLTFRPIRQWTSHTEYGDGAFSILNDQQGYITAGVHGPVKIWDSISGKVIREFEGPQNTPIAGVVVSPRGKVAALQGWWNVGIIELTDGTLIKNLKGEPVNKGNHILSKPQFIFGGKYLIVQSDKPSLHIYDSDTWERPETIPEIPSGALSFYPSAKTGRAVYLNSDGAIILRNLRSGKNIATLDNAKIERVAFSPDEKSFALASIHPTTPEFWGSYRIRLFDSRSGALLGELRAFEQKTIEGINDLRWSGDGK